MAALILGPGVADRRPHDLAVGGAVVAAREARDARRQRFRERSECDVATASLDDDDVEGVVRDGVAGVGVGIEKGETLEGFVEKNSSSAAGRRRLGR